MTVRTQQNNKVASKGKKPFSAVINAPAVKDMINKTLGDPKKSERFTVSIVSAVSNNPALQECDGMTIISAALIGEGLQLSPSPQLGHYYMVPFKNNKLNKTDAQFQLGYKGYIQLAIRSGQYKTINVLSIKEGELISYNPLNEELDINIIEDELVREKTKTTGYYAMFELVNGFKKTMYWSKEKMEAHALKYSKGYQAKKGYTFWEKDFDGMAHKTMLRQILSKWGIMSIEMQTAYNADMAVIREDGTPDYIDVEVQGRGNNDEHIEQNVQINKKQQQNGSQTVDFDNL